MAYRKRFRTIFGEVKTEINAYVRSQGTLYFSMLLWAFLAFGAMGVLYALLPIVYAKIARPKTPAEIVVTTEPWSR